jgi:hypothetical protein
VDIPQLATAGVPHRDRNVIAVTVGDGIAPSEDPMMKG